METEVREKIRKDQSKKSTAWFMTATTDKIFLYGRRRLLLLPGFTRVAVLASGTSAAHVALFSERRTSG